MKNAAITKTKWIAKWKTNIFRTSDIYCRLNYFQEKPASIQLFDFPAFCCILLLIAQRGDISSTTHQVSFFNYCLKYDSATLNITLNPWVDLGGTHYRGSRCIGAAQKKPHKEAVVFFNSIQGWIQCCCKILKINTRKVQTADIVCLRYKWE